MVAQRGAWVFFNVYLPLLKDISAGLQLLKVQQTVANSLCYRESRMFVAPWLHFRL